MWVCMCECECVCMCVHAVSCVWVCTIYPMRLEYFTATIEVAITRAGNLTSHEKDICNGISDSVQSTYLWSN